MKILQICNKAPYPPKDGGAIATFNMAMGLVANNVEVHLLAINTKKQYRPDSEIPKAFVKAVNYTSVYRDTDVNPVGALKNLFGRQSYFVSRFYFKEYAAILKAKLLAENFDVIQIEGVFMACYLPIIRKYSKAKIVLRSHNVEYLIWERYLQSSKELLKKTYIGVQKNRLKKFEKSIFALVDAIVPITDVDAKFLANSLPSKPIFSSITGIDMTKYPLIDSLKSPKSMFYFGSMDWLPNLEAVEWFKNNCWEAVKQNTPPDFKWIIAGLNMPAHVKAYDKDDRIETISNVPDAFEFYKTYNIQLAPILSGSGLRIKLVEGISYGKPIVTTTIGMEGLYCKHEQELLVADSPKDFATAVVRLVNNQDNVQQHLAHNARVYASQNFDNKMITQKLLSFYKSL